MKLALIQTATTPLVANARVNEDIRDDGCMLGLVSIATYIREYGGFKDTLLIDAAFDNPVEEIKKFKPDIVGLSSMAISQNTSTRFAEKIKEECNIPVMLGGVHISTLPESLPKIFDVGVVGEGEQTTLEILQNFEKTGSLINENIDGLVFYSDGRLKITKPRKLIEPLDKIPVLDRSFLHPRYYEPIPDWSGQRLIKGSIMTARGCPYKCRFCSTSHFWERFRFHSPERVIQDLEEIVKFKVQMVNINDDLFTVSLDRLKKILELMKKHDILGKFKITVNARANLVTDELCKTLKEMNVTEVTFGFESGSDKMLKWLKRESVTVEQNRNAIDLIVKNGMIAKGSLIFGSPTETIEDMKDTLKFIDYAHEHGAESLWYCVATPFPKTEFWDIGKQRGLVSENMNWDTLSLVNYDNPMLLDENVNREQYKEIIKEAVEKRTKYFSVKNKVWKARTLTENIKFLIYSKKTLSKTKLIFEILKNSLIKK